MLKAKKNIIGGIHQICGHEGKAYYTTGLGKLMARQYCFECLFEIYKKMHKDGTLILPAMDTLKIRGIYIADVVGATQYLIIEKKPLMLYCTLG